MAASINEILSTTWTTRVVTRQAGVNRYLLRLFGFEPGGSAERVHGHRQFGYDIFNDTRTIMQGRGPGVAAGTVTRQSVGRVNGVFPRFYEKLILLSEELHNIRVIGGPSSVFDERGVQYAIRQQRFMGQRLGNLRSLMLGGLFRGAMYGHKSGDDIYYDYTSSGAAFTVDWKMPAGNQNQCGGNISATWATSTTNIPNDLANLNASLQQTVGTSLELIICGSAVWQNVINNDYVQQQAGVAATPFSILDRVEGVEAGNGRKQTVIRARLVCAPWIDWIITDEGIKVGAPGAESFVKYIPDNTMWWGPMPSPEYFEMLLGGEPVNEGRGAPEVVRNGAFAWTVPVSDPSGHMMYSLDNCIPANYIPACNGLATVVY